LVGEFEDFAGAGDVAFDEIGDDEDDFVVDDLDVERIDDDKRPSGDEEDPGLADESPEPPDEVLDPGFVGVELDLFG